MKNFIKLLLVISLISTIISCSEDYGYDFPHGYDLGDVDDTINSVIDTNRRLIDKSKFTKARIFPGLVSDTEKRLENHEVLIDLNYRNSLASDLRINTPPGNWQSTSMYAPAGELITIEVPEAVYGLSVLVGAHTYSNISDIPVPQRDPDITVLQILFPGKNYVRNLYGGLIYIIPSAPLGKVVPLKFTGVVKAPSFKVGVTDPETWKTEIKNSSVPWFELEGNRIIFTLETSRAKSKTIDDPELLMQTWDKSIKEGFWDWTGLTENNPDPKHRAPFNKWRIVHDVLFRPGVAQVAGYPVRVDLKNGNDYFSQAIGIEGVKYSNWGTYHELGHNMQQNSIWSIAGGNMMGEVTNNIYSFKIANMYGRVHLKIKNIWEGTELHTYLESTDKWDNMDVKYPSSEVTRKLTALGNEEVFVKTGHLDIKLFMYGQIFEKYGYEFMTYLSKRARDARFTSSNNQSKYDFFYEALCEYTNTDMLPYFETWGWVISDVSKTRISSTLGLPKLTKKVWKFNPYTKTGGDENI